VYCAAVVYGLVLVLGLGTGFFSQSLGRSLLDMQLPIALVLCGFYLELARRVSIVTRSFRRAAEAAEETWAEVAEQSD
jgi:hypothetical protein